MIDLLEKLWLKGQLPIIQGIVKNNGYYFKLENDKNQIKIAEPAQFSFDFESNNFSDINPLFEIKYNQYTLYCGEGSWGGDGFLYVENTETKKMLWCLFSDTINPIIKCKVSGNKIIAENNNGITYRFDFENPEQVEILKRHK